MRRTKTTDGRAFQDDLVRTCLQYQSKGLLRMKKVDPPLRVLGSGFNGKTLFLKNPFPDFIGCWPAQRGRMVALEAKSTKDGQLPVGGKNGVKETQLEALLHWHRANAVAAVLWEWRGHGVSYITAIDIKHHLEQMNVKHIKWDNKYLARVKRGDGFILHDFYPVMESLV